MYLYSRILKSISLVVLVYLFMFPVKAAIAQSLLEKKISIDFKDMRVASVLAGISQKGGFYFSYNGRTIAKDSLVTIKTNNQTISKTLNQLFGSKYEYEERNNYLIIRPALMRLSFVNTDITTDNHNYSISGIVIDDKTGERLMNTSVYDKERLVSTLTDEHGYFKLKISAGGLDQVRLTASRFSYRDTSLNFLNTIVISNRSPAKMYQTNGKGVDATALGKFLLTAAQRLQSINIQDFFANRPYQVSLTPGLSSHGTLSSQVINKFSLNFAGGYTSGVDGMEIGGLFNINKRDTRYLQLAGIFNLVGGKVTGIQLAGVSNQALDTVKGVQVSGFINNQIARFRVSRFLH